MGRLTKTQRDDLREFLTTQGLTFKPLLEEMVDHMSCDLEERMSEGFSFDEAWHQSMATIPSNHFQLIQQETMESITKRFNLSRSLSYMALGLLFCSTVFKILHLQFTDALLLLSFACIAAPLLLNTLSGIYRYKEKKGAIQVLGVVVGVILLMVGYCFKIFHLQGADSIILVAIIFVITSMLLNMLHAYQRRAGEGNLLAFLHEKYTPGIERFFLFLLIPLTIYKVISITVPAVGFRVPMILLMVIFGTGLQFIALNWRMIETSVGQRNVVTLTGIIISFLCFTLPFLGPILPWEFRVVIIILFSFVSATVAYTLDTISGKITSLIMAILVPVIFLSWGLIKLSVIPASVGNVFFNLPILLALVGGLFLCRQNSIMRAYMMISLAGYLMEYLL